MSLRHAFIRSLSKLLRECGYEVRRVQRPKPVQDAAYHEMHERLRADVEAMRLQDAARRTA